MSQLACAPKPKLDSKTRKLLLVGQPNVGKSLLFTRLTNRYATVSNYPGTTVEITSALAELDGELREVVDTPGANTLAAQSNDERVTRDILLATDGDVLQVGDINNLHRTLLLSLQLAEHGIPFTLCLNMSDEANGNTIDVSALSELLGVPVIATSALRRWNLEKLKRHAVTPRRARLHANYPLPVEKAIREFTDFSRGEALSFLTTTPLAGDIAAARSNAVEEIVTQVYGPASAGQGTRPAKAGPYTIGALAMHPKWGFVILAFVLYGAWLFVGKLGAGVLVDFVEHTIFGAYINPWSVALANAIIPWKFLRDLLVGQYGVITMALTYAIAIVLPVVITFFTLFGILEDSGYLPRLAVMLHRTFRRMGLNGKAVLPMVLGLGCDTMATLTTRILDTPKEAIIVTILLALGIPCSAQLGVIMAMLGRLTFAATAVWLGVTLATIFLVGYLASKVVPGESGDFIVEIPPMRVPRLSNILIKVLARTEWYLKEAVPLFIAGTLLLYVLDAAHLLGYIQRALSPIVVGALGLPAEAANAFVVGFLRRDYGAAGLFAMQKAGALNPTQTVIALTVITLFIPCIANFFVMIRERGGKAAAAIAIFIIVYAFGIGALMNAVLKVVPVRLG